MARLKRENRYKFRSFEETRQFARKLGLASMREWRSYCASPRRPLGIPTNPQVAYQSDWKGWGDFLGTGNIKNSFLPFHEARNIARSLRLQTMAAYRDAARARALPPGLPKDPYAAYRNSGWQNSKDWLGTSHQSSHEKGRKKRPFTEVLDFTRSLGLRSKTDWFRWAKSGNRPIDIPETPRSHTRGKAGKVGRTSWEQRTRKRETSFTVVSLTRESGPARNRFHQRKNGMRSQSFGPRAPGYPCQPLACVSASRLDHRWRLARQR